jgi:hypothetical protein
MGTIAYLTFAPNFGFVSSLSMHRNAARRRCMRGICSVLGDNAGDDDDEISSRCMSKYHHDRSHYGHYLLLAALSGAKY